MSEQAQTDQAGIERTLTGEIQDQGKSLTSITEATETKTEPTKTETKSEDKSLLNQDGKKEETKSGAPEKYEDFKVPEGFELDKDVATEATAIFKELGVSQEGAQKLVDFYIAKAREAAEQPFKAYQDMRNGWREEAENHPQLRNRLNGDNSPVKQSFGKLMNALGDQALADSFRQAMDLTGAGDHPAFIRVVDILGSLLTEGAHVKGGGPSKEGQIRPGSGPQSAAKALYPNLP